MLKRPPSDSDTNWGGWTRSIEHPFPLEKIRREGYDVEEKRDEFGIYYQIVLKNTPS